MVFGIWENTSTVDCRLFEMNPVAIDVMFRFYTKARKYITLSANTLSNQNNRIPNQIDLMWKTVCIRCTMYSPIQGGRFTYGLLSITYAGLFTNGTLNFNTLEIESNCIRNFVWFCSNRNSWHLKFWFITINSSE